MKILFKKSLQRSFITAILVIIALSIFHGPANAQNGFKLLEPLPCIPGNGVECTGNMVTEVNFEKYVQSTFNLIIAIAAALAVFMTVYGGLMYMTKDSYTGKKEGLDKAKNALLGLVLVLTSYLILRTVDPRLVAIPSTLVAPLNIDMSKYRNISREIFAEFEKDLRTYQSDMRTFTNKINQTKDQISALESSIQQIDSQLSSIYGQEMDEQEISRECNQPNLDEQIRELCRQRAQKAEESVNLNQIQNLNMGMAVMRASVQHCGSMSNLGCFKNLGEAAKFTEIYNRYSSKTSTEYARILYTYRTFALNWFNLNAAMASPSSLTNRQAWENIKNQSLTNVQLAIASITTFANENTDVIDRDLISDMNNRKNEMVMKATDLDKNFGTYEPPVILPPTN
jgi:hypothetical protein